MVCLITFWFIPVFSHLRPSCGFRFSHVPRIVLAHVVLTRKMCRNRPKKSRNHADDPWTDHPESLNIRIPKCSVDMATMFLPTSQGCCEDKLGIGEPLHQVQCILLSENLHTANLSIPLVSKYIFAYVLLDNDLMVRKFYETFKSQAFVNINM